jgi:bacillithiol biosynthesis deacetylase BshB1
MVDVLAIGCHPDDVEIGMGGTIAKMVRTGISVGILDLSNGEPTPQGTPEDRPREAEKAKKMLGADFRITLDMPNRYIFDSVENRTKVATVLREHRPKAIFMHYWDDYHPDHVQGFNIVYAARFYGKLTKTDMPHEPYYTPKMYFYAPIHIHYTIKPSFIIALDDEDIEKKLEALKCYKSQFKDKKELLHDYARGRTSHAGSLIGRKWGEPFFSKEEMPVDDLRTLL